MSTPTLREAAQAALLKIDKLDRQLQWEHSLSIKDDQEFKDLRAALAEPQGESIAYLTYKGYLLHAADPKVAEHSNDEAQALIEQEISGANDRLPQTRQIIIENRVYTITFLGNGGYSYIPGSYVVPPSNSLKHTFDMGEAWTKVATVTPPMQAEPLEQALDRLFKGIDQEETYSDDGWWETSGGAEFGAAKYLELKKLLGIIK